MLEKILVILLTIIHILLSIIFYLLSKKNKKEKLSYDFYTKYKKSTIYFFMFYFLFPIVMNIIIFIGLIQNNISKFYPPFILSIIFCFFSIALEIHYLFEYVAIKDNNVINSTFRKNIIINIKDIYSVNKKGWYNFRNKNNELIFALDKGTENINEFIQLLESKTTLINYINNDITHKNLLEKYTEKDIKKYERIGREYRSLIKERNKSAYKTTLFKSIGFALMLGIFCYFFKMNYLIIIPFTILTVLFDIYNLKRKNKLDSKKSDFELGLENEKKK